MKIGLVGLGRMGGNMRERIRAAGHEVVGYDRDPTSATQAPCRRWSNSSRHRAWCG